MQKALISAWTWLANASWSISSGEMTGVFISSTAGKFPMWREVVYLTLSLSLSLSNPAPGSGARAYSLSAGL
jgi:hypothetical protein